ncbi:alpha/beta hydrolase family protein [Brucella sp. IR073]|uniref:alpha/beta hydrolase family protein n=1 Tax=unclassified Brucella TaxID=2632610 RepID=UPI003B985610
MRLHILSLAALLCATVAPCHADEAGVRQIGVAAPQRGQELAVTVWYPAETGGTSVLIGDNALFKGSQAFRDAPAAKGRFPLVLLSHGSGGRAEGMGWLATELAKAGFVVAGPNHPGTTSGDSTPADTPKIWERTQDLTAIMDRLTTDPQWRNTIDPDRIGVVGFSLGGTAAMEIAGARANLEAFARYCDNYTKWDCAWFGGGKGYVGGKMVKVDKVDLRKIDRTRFEQSNLDRRIKTAVLIDPGLAQAYDSQSLKEIAIPMHFINLGSGSEIPPGVIADKLASLTPRGTYVTVKDANHFSFLPECKEGSADLLKSMKEIDPVCEDSGKRSRADIHSELSRLVLEALKGSLKAGF